MNLLFGLPKKGFAAISAIVPYNLDRPNTKITGPNHFHGMSTHLCRDMDTVTRFSPFATHDPLDFLAKVQF